MLELTNLSKTFNGVSAVNDLSLTVPAGEIHGIIGPNGSGKSTVMNLISGSLPITSGSVRFHGKLMNGLGTYQIARLGVIRTFQLTRVFSDRSVFDAVRIGSMAARLNFLNFRSWLPQRNDDTLTENTLNILEQTGLSQLINKKTGSLPGGTQRILSLATALNAEPKILLLDEPLAGLNASEKAEVVSCIKNINKLGISILLVEHDVRSVLALCDRVTVIDFGNKIASGIPAEITRNERVIRTYLGNRGGVDANHQ